ncbi:MAG: cysteine synthase A [Candidatus Eisenbacteria bacterium]|nr:cysteine synthase A [Candidatus Eisenbacteria bacterium]
MYYSTDVSDLIGDTPLVKLTRMTDMAVFAKAEFLNPGGSIKDRVAKHIIFHAEKNGELPPGTRIVEATSGNTGIGIALVGVQRGHPVTIVMPENMSEERKKIIQALGAELILTPAKGSMEEACRLADEIRDREGGWQLRQFTNPLNPETHYLFTGPEIWDRLDGRIEAFVAGIGSGGTLGGVGRFLKERNPSVRIIAVEPKKTAALLRQEPGLHAIQGIGDGFVPECLDTSLIDDLITVSDEDAIETTRELARKQGLLAGTSSGANVWAATFIARAMGPTRNVVTVLPDRAERYFSTALI